MASASEAVFKDMVRECELEEVWEKLKARNWTTMRKFMHATSYNPQHDNDTHLVEQVIKPLVADDIQKYTLVRCLWFQSYSAIMMDMKAALSGPSDKGPRKLTQPDDLAAPGDGENGVRH